MPAPAAISGTFADLRQVKSRGVWQLVVDIPAERIEDVVKAFGMPRQDEPTWLGIARLKISPVASTPESAALASADDVRRPPQNQPSSVTGETKREYTLANRIGMTCADPAFREWLYRTHGLGGDADVAEFVRIICGVKSRADILPGTPAATKWHALALDYEQATGRMAEERR